MSEHFHPADYGFQPGTAAYSHWRDMDETGHITGIPHSHGRAIATNGILVVVVRTEHDFIIGHVENWQRFKEQREQRESKARKARKPTVSDIDFLA